MCSNCNGCFRQGVCNEYDEAGKSGPVTKEDCTSHGGEDCQGKFKQRLTCAVCNGCIYDKSCIEYDITGNIGFLSIENCLRAGGTNCKGRYYNR